MSSTNYYRVFADWLSISYAASCSPYSEILALLSELHDYTERPKGKDKTLYEFPNIGTLFVTHTDSFHNFSFSGGLLKSLKDFNMFRSFLITLGSHPHNITRLDAALDVPIAGHIIMGNIKRAYPSGYAEICGTKRKIQYITSHIDGVQTGTTYFQSKGYSGYVFLRVYDKADEAFVKSGVELPPTTRYELTAKRGASLRDLENPMSLFWHYMPDKVLKCPPHLQIPAWSPAERVEYDDIEESSPTDIETLRYLVENSSALQQLVKQAQSINGGDFILLRAVETALGVKSRKGLQ